MLKNIKTGTCDYVKYQFKAIFFAIFCNYLRNFDVVQIIYVIHKLINVNATIVSNTPPLGYFTMYQQINHRSMDSHHIGDRT